MALFVKDSGGSGDFTPIPEANYMARCIRVVDLGQQLTPFKNEDGSPKYQHKITLMFELPGKLIMDKKLEKEMPRIQSKDFTLSLHKESKLRPVLESLRGRKYTDEEVRNGVDISKLVGTPCSVEIFHKEGKEGKKYTEIGTISSLIEGAVCPSAIHEVFAYDIDEGRCEKFYKLPEWTQKKIAASPDWKGGGTEGDPAFQGLTPEEQAHQEALANPIDVPPPSDDDYMEIPNSELPF